MVIKLNFLFLYLYKIDVAYGKTRIQTRLAFMDLGSYCYYVGGVYMPFYSAWKICIFAGPDSSSVDNGVRLLSVYTITPDSFTLAIRGMKPRHVFPLQNITEIEKEYTKSGKLKSIVIRYRKEGMYHNF